MELISNKKSRSTLHHYGIAVLSLFMVNAGYSAAPQHWETIYPEDNNVEMVQNASLMTYFNSALFFFLKKDYLNTIATIKKFGLTNQENIKKSPDIAIKSYHLYASSLIFLDLPLLAKDIIESAIRLDQTNNSDLNFWYRSSLDNAKMAYELGSTSAFDQALSLHALIEKKLESPPKRLKNFKLFLIAQDTISNSENAYRHLPDNINAPPKHLKLWRDDKFLLPPSDLDSLLLEAITLQNQGLDAFQSTNYTQAIARFQASNAIIIKQQEKPSWKSSNIESIKNELYSNNLYYTAKVLFINRQYQQSLSTLEDIPSKNRSHLILAGWNAFKLEDYAASESYWTTVASTDEWSIEKLEAMSLLADESIQPNAELALSGHLAFENVISKSLNVYYDALAKIQKKGLVPFLVNHYNNEKSQANRSELSVIGLLTDNISKYQNNILKKIAFWGMLKEKIKNNGVSSQANALDQEWTNVSNTLENQLAVSLSKKLQENIDYLEEMQENSTLSIINLYEKMPLHNER